MPESRGEDFGELRIDPLVFLFERDSQSKDLLFG
jgi:hypothetical protein